MIDDHLPGRPRPDRVARFRARTALWIIVVGTFLFGGILLDLSMTATDEQGVPVVGVVDSVDPDAPGKYDHTLYHYTVNGKTYHGATTGNDVSTVGHKIELRYDPDDPSDSWRPRVGDTPPSAHPGPGTLTILIAVAVVAVPVVITIYRRREPRS